MGGIRPTRIWQKEKKKRKIERGRVWFNERREETGGRERKEPERSLKMTFPRFKLTEKIKKKKFLPTLRKAPFYGGLEQGY